MGTPFLGEVRMFSFSFAPRGWAFCNGSLMPINQNQGLFALLGTMYGGNGQTTFALPDLQGRVPMHIQSTFHTQGQRGGEQAHTLSTAEMPTHLHLVNGTSAAASTPVPTGNLLANSTAAWYAEAQQLTTLRPETVTNVGGSQAHNNMAPYSVTNFCIALQGFFPSQS